MAYFQVEGGCRLHGEITPQGAKNEALQILCATLLTPERVVVHNVPEILDVMQLIDLLRAMGVEVERLADDTYAFCAREIDLGYLLTEDYRRRCTRLRGSKGTYVRTLCHDIGAALGCGGWGMFPNRAATRSAGGVWIRTSSAFRSWAPSSTSMPRRSSSRSTARSCAAVTCCSTRRR